VGLVTAVGLAELGHRVECVDIDPGRVATINEGACPVHEPGLAELITRHVGTGLTATMALVPAVQQAEMILICVGTPSGPGGAIDLSALLAAADAIGTALRDAPHRTPTVVVKSTVVPGTTDGPVTELLEKYSGRTAGVNLGVGVNPEFLTEGQAVADFLSPDRLILGGDAIALAALNRLYAGFGDVPRVQGNARTAEMIKYAANTMLATAISFSNEIATLSSALGGIDATEVMRGVHLSRYLTGPAGRAELAGFYLPGCGYGGSCLPKDVAALRALGASVGTPTPLLDAVAAVNAQAPRRLVELCRQALWGELSGRRIAVLGLAFKPGTDDTRCSPAFPVLRALLSAGATVTVHDPVVGPEALVAEGLTGARHTNRLADAVHGAEAVVLVTSWPDYADLPALVHGADQPPLVIDGRRMLEPDSVPGYLGIGR
jgi:UDPglucose 6-dehydrogenase/GDP-mannose 6-dehydrogenase